MESRTIVETKLIPVQSHGYKNNITLVLLNNPSIYSARSTFFLELSPLADAHGFSRLQPSIRKSTSLRGFVAAMQGLWLQAHYYLGITAGESSPACLGTEI